MLVKRMNSGSNDLLIDNDRHQSDITSASITFVLLWHLRHAFPDQTACYLGHQRNNRKARVLFCHIKNICYSIYYHEQRLLMGIISGWRYGVTAQPAEEMAAVYLVSITIYRSLMHAKTYFVSYVLRTFWNFWNLQIVLQNAKKGTGISFCLNCHTHSLKLSFGSCLNSYQLEPSQYLKCIVTALGKTYCW